MDGEGIGDNIMNNYNNYYYYNNRDRRIREICSGKEEREMINVLAMYRKY